MMGALPLRGGFRGRGPRESATRGVTRHPAPRDKTGSGALTDKRQRVR